MSEGESGRSGAADLYALLLNDAERMLELVRRGIDMQAKRDDYARRAQEAGPDQPDLAERYRRKAERLGGQLLALKAEHDHHSRRFDATLAMLVATTPAGVLGRLEATPGQAHQPPLAPHSRSMAGPLPADAPGAR